MTDDTNGREGRPRKTVDEFATRYDAKATKYDEKYGLGDDGGEYAETAELVVEHADVDPDDVVVDLGAGTGIVTVELAEDATKVIGRDISDRMLEKARDNAAEREIENVRFDRGSFREPNVEEADIVVTNLALHHLGDEAKRNAIEVVSTLEPRRFVIGAAMFFDERDPDDPEYDPEVVYPSTVGNLVHWLTDAGFAVTTVEKISSVAGVVVAERIEGN